MIGHPSINLGVPGIQNGHRPDRQAN